MKIPIEFFIFGFFILVLGGAGTFYYVQTDQVQNDVDAHMADLRQTKDKWDPIQADLTAALKEMFTVNRLVNSPRAYSPQDIKSLQERIDKDQSDIKILSSRIKEDVDFLKAHWSFLSQPDRNYVTLLRVIVM